MVKNLFDYADTPIEEINSSTYKRKEKYEQISDKTTIDQIDLKQAYNKYKDMPQDALVEEFLKVAKNQRLSGALNNEKIAKMYNTLSPYLNADQKEMFNTLMNKLDE